MKNPFTALNIAPTNSIETAEQAYLKESESLIENPDAARKKEIDDAILELRNDIENDYLYFTLPDEVLPKHFIDKDLRFAFGASDRIFEVDMDWFAILRNDQECCVYAPKTMLDSQPVLTNKFSNIDYLCTKGVSACEVMFIRAESKEHVISAMAHVSPFRDLRETLSVMRPLILKHMGGMITSEKIFVLGGLEEERAAPSPFVSNSLFAKKEETDKDKEKEFVSHLTNKNPDEKINIQDIDVYESEGGILVRQTTQFQDENLADVIEMYKQSFDPESNVELVNKSDQSSLKRRKT